MSTILFLATDYFHKKKLKNPIGRPPAIDKTTLTKLEDAFSIGLSDKKACAYAGINPRTLYRYQQENPEFSQRKEELKLRPDIRAQKGVVGSLDDPKWGSWWLERRDPEFRPNTKVEHSGLLTHQFLVTPQVQAAVKIYEEVRRKQIKEEARELLAEPIIQNPNEPSRPPEAESL